MNLQEVKRMGRVVMSNTFTLCGKKMAEVPIDCMVVDSDVYQRPVQKTIQKIATGWNTDKLDNLLLSYRDGLFHVIDGQNRMEAAKLIGIDSLPATILEGLTVHDEALLFGKQTENVTYLKPYDIFKANTACGDVTIPAVKVDMQINDVCIRYNIPITQSNGRGLASITRARRICQASVDAFEWVIKLLKECGRDDRRKGMSVAVLMGVHRCYTEYDDKDKVYQILLAYLTNTSTSSVILESKRKYPRINEEAAMTNYLSDVVRECMEE